MNKIWGLCFNIIWSWCSGLVIWIRYSLPSENI